MRLHDDEIQEWHEHIWRQRNRYRRLLENICTGVPIIYGMASDYRQLKLDEIRKMAKELLEDEWPPR